MPFKKKKEKEKYYSPFIVIHYLFQENFYTAEVKIEVIENNYCINIY